MNKIRKYIDLALSVLFISTAILGYYKDVSHMSEYCFISGILVGIIFFYPSYGNKNKMSYYQLVYI